MTFYKASRYEYCIGLEETSRFKGGVDQGW